MARRPWPLCARKAYFFKPCRLFFRIPNHCPCRQTAMKSVQRPLHADQVMAEDIGLLPVGTDAAEALR